MSNQVSHVDHNTEHFDWSPQVGAEATVSRLLDLFMQKSKASEDFAKRMRRESGTRFRDWVDFIEVPEDSDLTSELEANGFTCIPSRESEQVWVHEEGLFPEIVLSGRTNMRVGIKVDSVAKFLCTWRMKTDHVIDGEPFSLIRRSMIFSDPGAELWVIERYGSRSFDIPDYDPAKAIKGVSHLESMRRRPRDFQEDDHAWAILNAMVDAAITDIGVHQTCAYFFLAEREYWESRNNAAQFQKKRQDLLGLGWANHDHHTFRSSRAGFPKLIALLEKLGFECRERFYAGEQAGWGAQVLEQKECHFTVFADVDMSPEEVAGDFAHQVFKPHDYLGTVGLWVGLHGESVLQAGMHHLECQFDFEALRDQMEAAGFACMDPFTDWDYLKQQFTVGERWEVSESRVNRLVESDMITGPQATQFLSQGAIGSHLENLERHGGYKGFNQSGVSDIISRTDPRAQSGLRGG